VKEFKSLREEILWRQEHGKHVPLLAADPHEGDEVVLAGDWGIVLKAGESDLPLGTRGVVVFARLNRCIVRFEGGEETEIANEYLDFAVLPKRLQPKKAKKPQTPWDLL
jgi:hypothetical protein